MTTLTDRAKPVDRKKMTFLESIYLWNIGIGMLITIKHFFKKKVTYQYPEKTAAIQPGVSRRTNFKS